MLPRTPIINYYSPFTWPRKLRSAKYLYAMKIAEVKSPQDAKMFIQVNVDLNRQTPNYIRPLDKDVNEVFNPEKNKAFRFGEATRWILYNDEGKAIGRIAAFVNKK